MKDKTFTFDASDGTPLRVYRWTPGKARAVVHVAHGMGEHAARYARLAAALVGAGYAVYCHDQRGHGHSVSSKDDLGVLGPDGWNQLVRDLSGVHAFIRAAHPDVPFVAMGHSMGSFALQQVLLDESDVIDAAILSGSASLDALAATVDTNQPISFDSFNAAFEPIRTEADWLSRDEAEVDAYVADPLCGFGVSSQATGELAAAAARLCDPRAIAGIRSDLPLYVFAGDADPVNAGLQLLEVLVGRYREAGLDRIETRFYPAGRHEMLNEINRDEVTKDLLEWLSRNLPIEGVNP